MSPKVKSSKACAAIRWYMKSMLWVSPGVSPLWIFRENVWSEASWKLICNIVDCWVSLASQHLYDGFPRLVTSLTFQPIGTDDLGISLRLEYAYKTYLVQDKPSWQSPISNIWKFCLILSPTNDIVCFFFSYLNILNLHQVGQQTRSQLVSPSWLDLNIRYVCPGPMCCLIMSTNV